MRIKAGKSRPAQISIISLARQAIIAYAPLSIVIIEVLLTQRILIKFLGKMKADFTGVNGIYTIIKIGKNAG